MELGEKIRQARLEAGLSQRQLCGQEITRNMLSQIEHGTARPSMKTLQYLAAQMGKPVSYFLEEQTIISPNQQIMETARRLYDAGDFSGAAQALKDYRQPDEVYDREKGVLSVCTYLALARRAMEQERWIYARKLLEKAEESTAYCGELLNRQRLLMLGKLDQPVSESLPSLDEELLLRAEEAWKQGKTARAQALLEAVEDQTGPSWCMLRGELYFRSGQFREAARCFHGAEKAYPRETAQKLEHCYRELEDYKRAYEYACKQKK